MTTASGGRVTFADVWTTGSSILFGTTVVLCWGRDLTSIGECLSQLVLLLSEVFLLVSIARSSGGRCSDFLRVFASRQNCEMRLLLCFAFSHTCLTGNKTATFPVSQDLAMSEFFSILVALSVAGRRAMQPTGAPNAGNHGGKIQMWGCEKMNF